MPLGDTYKNDHIMLEFVALIEARNAADHLRSAIISPGVRSENFDVLICNMKIAFMNLYGEYPWGYESAELRARSNYPGSEDIENIKLDYVAAIEEYEALANTSHPLHSKEFKTLYVVLFEECPWPLDDIDKDMFAGRECESVARNRINRTLFQARRDSLYDNLGTLTRTPINLPSSSLSHGWTVSANTTTVVAPTASFDTLSWTGTSPIATLSHAPLTSVNTFESGSKFTLMGHRSNQLRTRTKPPHPATTFASLANNARRNHR